MVTGTQIKKKLHEKVKLIKSWYKRTVVKSVEIEWISNQWVSTSYNVVGMQHTIRVLLIWRVQARAIVIASLSHPDLIPLFVFLNQLNIFSEKHFWLLELCLSEISYTEQKSMNKIYLEFAEVNCGTSHWNTILNNRYS